MGVKRKWPAMAAAVALILVLGACGGENPSNGSMGLQQNSDETSQDAGASPPAVTKLTPEEAKNRMEEGNVTVVDVRTAEEYTESHVPGAVLLPNEDINEESAQDLIPARDEVLLIYCRSGRRSAAASEKLANLGYTQVYDFGGILDWPYDTETGAFVP